MDTKKAASEPLISIVTATYNASQLLRFAIQSVIDSSYLNWEMLIIGDHCTDDTEELVSSFHDPRLIFRNLEKNSGQQATPNNLGISLAKGEYLCLLNQDDMFLPSHLSQMIEIFRTQDLDIALARYAIVDPFDPVSHCGLPPVRNGGPAFYLDHYRPDKMHVASSWFMRTLTALDVGKWRIEKETYVTPSQEWLFRAYKQGKKIVGTNHASVIALLSGDRRNSYLGASTSEHEYIYRMLSRPNLENELLIKIREQEALTDRTLRRRMRRVFYAIYTPIATALNIHPHNLMMILRFGRKGNFVRKWKIWTGN